MADVSVTPPATPSAAPSAAAPAPAPRSVPEAGSSAPVQELEIHTIPDKFYGAALRATLAERQKDGIGSEKGAPAQPPSARPAWFFPVIGGVAVLLFVAGGFVYFNRDLIFAKPAPAPTPVQEPTPPPPPPEPPAAPTNLTASTTALTVVHLSWTDVATDESSYRVERRDSTSSYTAIRNLAPNESNYDDPTVSPDTDYLYRVIAVNTNGESISSEASVRTSPMPDVPPPPPTLPPAGLDSDSDGLTDLEEPLYGSPVNNPDADKDSYNDGNEVYHLYSPSGKAPGKLLESGLVKKISSEGGWSFFAPSPWQMTVEIDGKKGTVLTGHGEMFVATVENNPDQKPLLDWYLAQHPGVLSSQVTTFKTQSGFEGLAGADQLSAYFAWGNNIFVLRYDLSGQPFVNFRTTFEMMKNSLVLSVTPQFTPPTPPVVETTPSTPLTSEDLGVPQPQPEPESDPEEEPFEIGDTGETP